MAQQAKSFDNSLKDKLRALRRWHWQSAVLDGCLLIIILLTLNYLFSPKNMGWLHLNPSPYLLLPIMIGARYGFRAGTLTGFMTALLVLYFDTKTSTALTVAEITQRDWYFLICYIILGGLCGQIQSFFVTRIDQKNYLLDNNTKRLRQLDQERYLLLEAKDEVDRVLATIDADVASLDLEIRRLCQCKKEEFFSLLLTLLADRAEIIEAAIYVKNSEGVFQRSVFIGKDSTFPQNLENCHSVKLALQKKDIVTLSGVWDQTKEIIDDYLIVEPFTTGDQNIFAILVVQEIRFNALNEQTIRTLHTICQWASRFWEARQGHDQENRLIGISSHQPLYTQKQFEDFLQLGMATSRQLRIPSSLILFYIQFMPEKHSINQTQFEQILIPSIRYQDIPAVLDFPMPHLALLLPLTGERGAHLCLDRVLTSGTKHLAKDIKMNARVFDVGSYQDLQSLMLSLHKYVHQTASGL